ncbi:MAG: hypothetical protein E3J35_06125 [Methanomassiliicoccales archaeon]|nr:MAG: hypothetical protein E3J35_06125 [Methanomassiliicoccales archaeon]
MNSRGASVFVMALVIVSTLSIMITILPENARGNILYVGGPGPGNYTTIQSAIDAANIGDTVYVFNGTYHEHLTINKTLNLIGEDRNRTIIDGDGFWDVVYVSADWVNITGFDITNAGSTLQYKGIYLDSADNCRIHNNTVSMNQRWGIYLEYSSNAAIEDNYFVSNGNALYFTYSDNASIMNNKLTDSYNAVIAHYSKGSTISGNSVSDGMFNIIVQGDYNTVTNNNISSNANYGITLYRSKHNLVANNHVQDNSLGVFLEDMRDSTIANNTLSNEYAGIDIWMSDNITVTNNSIFESREYGIRFVHSTHNTLTDNVMVDNGVYISGNKLDMWNTHTIDTSNQVNGKPVYYWKDVKGGIVPSGAGEVILANCTEVIVENQDLSNSTVGMQIGFSPSNTIVNNTASGNDQEGIYLILSKNIVLDNITVSSNKRYGLHSWWSDNMTLLNSNASGNRNGVFAVESDDLSFADNTAYMNLESGITIHHSNNSNIHNNTVGSTFGSGLRFGYLTNSTVENNIALSGVQGIVVSAHSKDNEFAGNLAAGSIYGLLMDSACSYNRVTNNNLSNNYYGLSLEYATNNTVANNSITHNRVTGVHFFVSHYNNVSGNMIFENAVEGANLRFSTNNRIYHNSFISNPLQAHDDESTNLWDNGYPSGGNYWSDYTGDDLYWGPNQDQPGSDGLGDIPYVIDVDTQDRYPLMAPPLPGFFRPPILLSATLSGQTLDNVTLTWTPSPDDGAGTRSVTGYEIYRNTTHNAEGNDYQLIASLPNATSQYVDNSAGEGNPNNYFYRLCAVGLNNTTECASDQAGKFTRQLDIGTNLVSIPIIQSDERIETVLQTVSFDKAWSFDSLNQEWNSFIRLKPYVQSLQYVNHTMGLWINVIKESNLTVAGIVPISTNIQLHSGWNLIGIPSFDVNYTVGDLKSTIPLERAEGFDPVAPPYFLRKLQDSDILLAGQGYWIQVPQDTIWTLTNT